MNLRDVIEGAAEGLVYSSESDRPFRWFFLEGGATGWKYDAAEFARRLGTGVEPPFEERSVDRFFKRHIEATDPYDSRAQEIRPRYEKLKSVIVSRLDRPTVFRCGRVEVRCFVVGSDGRGNLAGLQTESVET